MTTIAYKDGILAADSLVCNGSARAAMTTRKIRRIGKVLIAGCGYIGELEAFVDWVAAGMKDTDPLRGGETSALLLAPGQPPVLFGTRGPWPASSEYIAMGSGEDFAFGAFSAGADAVGAIEAAIRHDVYSGGPIVTLKL